MRKSILALFFLLSFLSCNKKHADLINVSFIEECIKSGSNKSSQIFDLILFYRCKDGKIVVSDIYKLRKIYLKIYNSLSYDNFLIKTLNQKINIECYENDTKFKINDKIEADYKSMGIDNFVKYYCVEMHDVYYQIKNGLSEEKYNTVLYILFINNYLIRVDNVSGMYKIEYNCKP